MADRQVKRSVARWPRGVCHHLHWRDGHQASCFGPDLGWAPRLSERWRVYNSSVLLGEDAYLKSAWNWLDGVVVMVSIINMARAIQGPKAALSRRSLPRPAPAPRAS